MCPDSRSCGIAITGLHQAISSFTVLGVSGLHKPMSSFTVLSFRFAQNNNQFYSSQCLPVWTKQ